MTAYAFLHDIGRNGCVADMTPKIVYTFGAEAEIGIGLPLKRGTDKATQVLPWADDINVDFLGIAIDDDSRIINRYLPNSDKKYFINDLVSVMTEGTVWVNAGDTLNIVAGEKAYLVATTGVFTNVATDNLLIGKFLTSGTGGTDLIKLEIGRL